MSEIATGAGEISAASDDLAMRNERQAASVEESATVTSQISTSMQESARGAGEASAAIQNSYTQATAGEEAVARAVLAMEEINASSKAIASIIDVIDGIAFQTNLLALNAGVEAARAGEAGRGFVVVAGEVRALAQRAAESAQDIKALIDSSTRQIAEGVERVNEAGEVIKETLDGFGRIRTMVADIAGTATAQSSDLEQVNTAIRAIDTMTQENAAMAEQSTAATRNLAIEARQLGLLVRRFRIASSPSGTDLRHAA